MARPKGVRRQQVHGASGGENTETLCATSRELLACLVESLQISSGDIFDGAPAADAIVRFAFTFSARLVCSHSVTQGVSG